MADQDDQDAYDDEEFSLYGLPPEMYENLNPEQIRRAFAKLDETTIRKADTNNDKYINLNEFQALLNIAFPNNPFSNTPSCKLNKDDLDHILYSSEGTPDELKARAVKYANAKNDPPETRAAESGISYFFARVQQVSKGLEFHTDCESIALAPQTKTGVGRG